MNWWVPLATGLALVAVIPSATLNAPFTTNDVNQMSALTGMQASIEGGDMKFNFSQNGNSAEFFLAVPKDQYSFEILVGLTDDDAYTGSAGSITVSTINPETNARKDVVFDFEQQVGVTSIAKIGDKMYQVARSGQPLNLTVKSDGVSKGREKNAEFLPLTDAPVYDGTHKIIKMKLSWKAVLPSKLIIPRGSTLFMTGLPPTTTIAPPTTTPDPATTGSSEAATTEAVSSAKMTTIIIVVIVTLVLILLLLGVGIAAVMAFKKRDKLKTLFKKNSKNDKSPTKASGNSNSDENLEDGSHVMPTAPEQSSAKQSVAPSPKQSAVPPAPSKDPMGTSGKGDSDHTYENLGPRDTEGKNNKK